MTRRIVSLFLVLFAVGCADTTEPVIDDGTATGTVDIPDFEDFVDGKEDTGYVGNRAFELEANFTGRVRVMVPDTTAEQLQTIAEALLDNPRSWEHRAITSQVTEQLKYARNTLKAQNLNLNLEGGNPAFSSIDLIEGGLELVYTVSVESLVKYKDLEDDNLTVEQLVGRSIDVRLPLLPDGLYDRVGGACATDPDTETGEVDPEDLGAHNLFYYFDPARDGCSMQESDLITGQYNVESSLDAPTVYPEYDQLVADGRVDMVVIFGQITHGDLEDNDWGFISFRSMTRSFQGRGFRTVETYDGNRGHRLERTYPGGLVVSIDMYTPIDFADHVDREVSNTAFRSAVQNNEIVYYNGHAFYGSLNVLDDPAVYPADVYQIINMDACWSYAYYTKQIFRNRATDDDPDGYALVDVVNNTEPGITGSEQTATILYDNIFRGAAAVHSGGNATLYSWNNIVEYMNEHAEARARRRTQYPDPEIYGVSGVTTNQYRPGSESGGGEPSGDAHTSDEIVEIPDNDSTGTTSRIEVDADGSTTSVRIRAQIDHTYVGDLVVELSHEGRTLTLHDRQGGSTDDLSLDVTTDAFGGAPQAGTWELSVRDHAARDLGQIRSWSVEFSN